MCDGIKGNLTLKHTKVRTFGNGHVLLCYEPECLSNQNVPDRSRTYNLRLRRPTLYPIELRELYRSLPSRDKVGKTILPRGSDGVHISPPVGNPACRSFGNRAKMPSAT